MKLKIDYLTKGFLLLFFAIGMTSFASAQRTISGTVTDADSGDPLIGANVLVVGTSSGTVTDIDGSYTLTVPEGATEIEVSYTGYATQRIALGASNVLDVALSAGELLDEVVVVGYGTTTRKQVTSAVQSVKAEDFNQGNVNDPIQLVQGKVAGLSISTVGNDPNGSATLRLRGLNTLGANTAPLVVIDGVIGGSLNTVDPNDIESIDVLKDGSAAAIYGTRASSGVIIVTTKKGEKGQTSVEYNGFATVESIAKKWDVADAQTFASFRANNPETLFGSNTDWIDQVTQTGFSHVHNLSMSGGAGSTTYRAAFNFRDVEGIGLNSGFQQTNGRLNLQQKALDDRLTIGLNVSATQREIQQGFEEAFRYAVIYNPTAPVFTTPDDPLYEKYGGYFQAENFDYFNPFAIADQSTDDRVRKDILVNVNGEYELTEGLSVGASYSIQRENQQTGVFYPNNAYFRGFNDKGRAERNMWENTNELFELTGKYNADFGSTSLNAVVGYSWNELTGESFGGQGLNYISNDVLYNNLGFSTRKNVGDPNAVFSNKDQYRVIGFFGRLSLDIDDKYFVSVSAREEGSSRFGKNNRWGLFPSASVGANIAKIADLSGVDQLKVRVGFGQTGSLPPESYLSQFRYTQQGNFFFNGGFVPAFGPNRNANPDLKWEVKTEIDAGIDFAMLDYKLTGTIDYFNRTTEDLIYNVLVPVPPNFANTTWANLDDVELATNGVELTLSYNHSNQDGSFRWTPTLTFGTAKTKLNVKDVSNATFSFFQSDEKFFQSTLTSPGAPGLNDFPQIAVIGNEEIGNIWGAVHVSHSPDGWVFQDTDGDGTVEVGFGGEDNTIIGNGLPDFSFGLLNTFAFNNLDFSFFFRGDVGHDLMNMYRVFYEYPTSSRLQDNIVMTKYFDESLPADPFPSSLHVEDASYVVLDNATLGYNFELPSGSAFKKIRLYLTGRNLFYITGYTGVDPSVRYADPGNADNGGAAPLENNPDPLAPGLDRRNNYFRTRSFTVGAQLGF
ncbi:MAG: SusC/RagA family TonB-linked outer membrane protein [Bacteroidetes bacterium]|nr:MAG: SusC/RagA family TonB-linked outer membrane protein [Bacteroidota bacterium]